VARRTKKLQREAGYIYADCSSLGTNLFLQSGGGPYIPDSYLSRTGLFCRFSRHDNHPVAKIAPRIAPNPPTATNIKAAPGFSSPTAGASSTKAATLLKSPTRPPAETTASVFRKYRRLEFVRLWLITVHIASGIACSEQLVGHASNLRQQTCIY